MATLTELPDDLPIPIDDGKCSHLTDIDLPDLILPSTQGEAVNLSCLSGLTVLYIYPMTGRPGIALPDGWDQIPGARGCTPQACSFRDQQQTFDRLNARVFGISTQSTSDQSEAAERLHLPFALLSDKDLTFAQALALPTMRVEGKIMLKRTTLICQDACIKQVFYPVFPPDENADQVLKWLQQTTRAKQPPPGAIGG